MKCPRCSNELTEVTAGTTVVEVCKNGCGGLFFDNFELERFDEQHENAEDLLNMKPTEGVNINTEERIKCPKCADITMMRHFFSMKKEVELDECPSCGGVWLDNGELENLRSQFKTESERHQATDKYFDQMFAPALKAAEAKNKAKLEKARRFAGMFRFLCPSAYIPGKQDWGAF